MHVCFVHRVWHACTKYGLKFVELTVTLNDDGPTFLKPIKNLSCAGFALIPEHTIALCRINCIHTQFLKRAKKKRVFVKLHANRVKYKLDVITFLFCLKYYFNVQCSVNEACNFKFALYIHEERPPGWLTGNIDLLNTMGTHVFFIH